MNEYPLNRILILGIFLSLGLLLDISRTIPPWKRTQSVMVNCCLHPKNNRPYSQNSCCLMGMVIICHWQWVFLWLMLQTQTHLSIIQSKGNGRSWEWVTYSNNHGSKCFYINVLFWFLLHWKFWISLFWLLHWDCRVLYAVYSESYLPFPKTKTKHMHSLQNSNFKAA